MSSILNVDFYIYYSASASDIHFLRKGDFLLGVFEILRLSVLMLDCDSTD